VAKHLQPAAQKAGITGRVGFHTLRRTLASALVANGSDLRLVQELLRHSNPLITLDAYARSDDTGEDRSSGVGIAATADGKLKSCARECKTREYTDDVNTQPMISRLSWVATHIKEKAEDG
jgi:hypothetical protein